MEPGVLIWVWANQSEHNAARNRPREPLGVDMSTGALPEALRSSDGRNGGTRKAAGGSVTPEPEEKHENMVPMTVRKI